MLGFKASGNRTSSTADSAEVAGLSLPGCTHQDFPGKYPPQVRPFMATHAMQWCGAGFSGSHPMQSELATLSVLSCKCCMSPEVLEATAGDSRLELPDREAARRNMDILLKRP